MVRNKYRVLIAWNDEMVINSCRPRIMRVFTHAGPTRVIRQNASEHLVGAESSRSGLDADRQRPAETGRGFPLLYGREVAAKQIQQNTIDTTSG